MDASQLLSGPRGRRLCWHLFGSAGYVLSERSLPAARDRLGGVLARLRSDDAATGEWLREALIFAIDMARYWQEPDEIDEFLTTPDSVALLRPVAAMVAAHPSVGWWESPLAVDDQWFVRFQDIGEPAEPPELTGIASRLRHQRDREERQNAAVAAAARDGIDLGGRWWSTPDRWDVPVTARARPDTGPVGLNFVEDHMGWRRATVWPVRVTCPPQVFEITGPDAWGELVQRYPLSADGRAGHWPSVTGRAARWLLPDWAAVAADYDAVHVSVAGYLRTAGLAVPVDDGRASVLAGWAPDECWWLTDHALELPDVGVEWRWPQRGGSMRWERAVEA